MATKVTYTSTTLGDASADAAFDAAVEQARADVREHELVIDGARRPGGAGTFEVQNPARHAERLGTFAEASDGDIAEAVRAARAFAPAWRQTPGAERLRILRAAAEAIRERAMYLSAVVALEVGKNRVEAVGEVQEAADLIDEYARQFEEHEEYVIRMRAASDR
jgi:1-pyrroline-5-carboxylate dehydrogenase